ncbi:MAG TPA: universal stress protein [Caulobacteraceae bacterium]|nr:universal stress protein [Caulobacteraceae bacterium]
MTYSSVMTHVQPEPEAAPRLDCAVDVARRFGARLIGVSAEMIPPLAFDNGSYTVDAEWAIAMRKSIEDQLRVAKEAFKRATAALADDAVWLCGIESPTPAIAAASRAADLIVLGGVPRRHDSPYRDCDPAEMAMLAGRPVLVAPPAGPLLSGKRIVVAWKDSREARRALSDSIPFLEAAEAVLVLEVCDGDGQDDARIRTGDVVAALRRRKVAAEAKVTLHAHAAASQQILEEVVAFGSDLIVLGCYGHSRLGEWVFGGVTRDLLSQDDVYLLLSH